MGRKKPTYEELMLRVRELEKKSADHNQSDETLKERDENFRSLVEITSDWIWEVNADGVFKFASQKVKDILGYAPEELVGKHFSEYLLPQESGRANELFAIPKASQKSVYLTRNKIIHKDGSIVFLESTVRPLLDDGGKLFGYQGASRNLTKRNKTEVALQRSEAALRRLSSKLLNIYETEGKRIGSELHDGIAQTVSAIKMKAEVALMQLDKKDMAEVRHSLEAIIRIAQGAVEDVRRISRNLRPSILDNLGILPTVSWLCREFENTYPWIRIEGHFEILEEDVSDSLKTVVFRIFQESLNNIAKHSQAKLVRLSLTRIDGKIKLAVDDNGVGFDAKHLYDEDRSEKGLGIASMRERVELSNGTFSIKSRKGAGTSVRAFWPAVNSVMP